MDIELVSGVSAVIIIVGLIEVIKTVVGLDSKLSPVLAIIFGLAASFGLAYYRDAVAYDAIVTGLAIGLSAVGLYSGTKNMKEYHR